MPTFYPDDFDIDVFEVYKRFILDDDGTYC